MGSNAPSRLPEILTRAGVVPALHPENDMPIEMSRFYIAPPDYHMLIDDSHILLSHGPKENRHRPAIDPLFRSAALAYGPRVIGVVLTGLLDDGTAGLLAIKQRGGITVVQDPADALYPSMPESALEHVAIDYVVPLVELASLLVRLVQEEVPEDVTYVKPEDMKREVQQAEMETSVQMGASDNHPGTPSVYSCPECGGVLWEIQDNGLLRFRCRVGHAFSIESIQEEQADALEEALWVALKIVEEKISLTHRLLDIARKNGNEFLIKRYDARAQEATRHAELLRTILKREEPATNVI